MKHLAPLLRRAARKIHLEPDSWVRRRHRYCCLAIATSTRCSELCQGALDFFLNLYATDAAEFNPQWPAHRLYNYPFFGHNDIPGNQEARILALLLAADVAEGGGL